MFDKYRGHYLERTSALDFEDAAAPRFRHSDAAILTILITNVKMYRHQSLAKCLINRICGNFDMNSNGGGGGGAFLKSKADTLCK